MSTEDVYRKLQRHLDRMPVPFPATESGVEIRILRALFTPEEARVVLALSMMPEPPAVISRRLRRTQTHEEVCARLESMAKRGLILLMPSDEGPKYGKTVFVVGFYEAQVNRLTASFERDVHQYLDEAFAKALHSLRTPQMRTVPINRTIPIPDRQVARYDDLTEMVKSSAGPFAVMNCICQQGQDILSEPCHQTNHREHCLMFGPAAEWLSARGDARLVSRDEMLEFLESADADGLVLQPQNTENPLFVCCCCGCCCGLLTTAKKLPKPASYFSTNYYAEVDGSECQGCGSCETRCQMEAVVVESRSRESEVRPSTVAQGASNAVETGPEPDGERAWIDLDRCIGCGLCASTCPSGAMHLVARQEVKTLPKDTGKLYERMFRDRYGMLGVAQLVGRKILGKPF